MSANEKNEDPLLDIDEVAERCRVTSKTITNWVSSRKEDFPRGFKLGKKRYWRQESISQYLKLLEQQAA